MRQKAAGSRHQTAISNQQKSDKRQDAEGGRAADIRQQSAESRQQTIGSRQQETLNHKLCKKEPIYGFSEGAAALLQPRIDQDCRNMFQNNPSR